MANTYSQVHIQFVFAVKHRRSMIESFWEDELFKYITGIVTNQKHKLLAINGMPDHIHLLVGLRPHQSISDLMKDVKSGSSKWINDRNLVKGKFQWQEGYGAFSYAPAQVDNVIQYIRNQKIHHNKKPFKKEYISLLESFNIDYDEKYVFEELA